MKTTTKIFIYFILIVLCINNIYSQNKKESQVNAKPVNLVLYAVTGTSGFNLKNLSSSTNVSFGTVSPFVNTYNLGAGFTSNIGTRFSYGADYLFGSSSNTNKDFNIDVHIFEAPVFVEYKVITLGGFSVAPQLGVNYGNIKVARFDNNATVNQLNSYTVKQDYLTGRIGLNFEYVLSNNMFFGIKSGYDFGLLGNKKWNVVGSKIDTGIDDNLGHMYANFTLGTKLNLLGNKK